MTDEPKLRLAMRAEGDFWNAYAALTCTMDGALLLGSIQIRMVENRDIKDAFMDLMQWAFADLLRSIGGEVTRWDKPRAAPESERAGRA